jgi:transposase-like protein
MNVDGNETLWMRAYHSRSLPATELFINEVLNCCDGEPMFVDVRAPCPMKALKGLG